jgi:hypothetical protein
MSDFTAQVQKPNLTGSTPVYNACTATDKFSALPGARYMLHYKNGATSQASGTNKITDQVSAGSAPSGAVLAGGWADAVTTGGTFLAANAESVVWIDNATRFRDSTGFVNLAHGGTLTTMTVAIFGPF